MSFIYRKENFTTTQKDLEIFLDVSHPTINGILKRLEEKKIHHYGNDKKKTDTFQKQSGLQKNAKTF